MQVTILRGPRDRPYEWEVAGTPDGTIRVQRTPDPAMVLVSYPDGSTMRRFACDVPVPPNTTL